MCLYSKLILWETEKLDVVSSNQLCNQFRLNRTMTYPTVTKLTKRKTVYNMFEVARKETISEAVPLQPRAPACQVSTHGEHIEYSDCEVVKTWA